MGQINSTLTQVENSLDTDYAVGNIPNISETVQSQLDNVDTKLDNVANLTERLNLTDQGGKCYSASTRQKLMATVVMMMICGDDIYTAIDWARAVSRYVLGSQSYEMLHHRFQPIIGIHLVEGTLGVNIGCGNTPYSWARMKTEI